MNKRMGFFVNQQAPGTYQPRFYPQKLNGHLVIIGNPITAWGLTPSAPMTPFGAHTWALIDPASAKITPMATPVTPEPVRDSLNAINSAVNSGLIAGAIAPAPAIGSSQYGSPVQAGSAQNALANTSLAPPAPAGCTSCGGSAPAQINGVTPAPASGTTQIASSKNDFPNTPLRGLSPWDIYKG